MDVLATLGVLLQDIKDDVLFARATDIIDANFFGDIDEFLGGLGFQISKVHRSFIDVLEVIGAASLESGARI